MVVVVDEWYKEDSPTTILRIRTRTRTRARTRGCEEYCG